MCDNRRVSDTFIFVCIFDPYGPAAALHAQLQPFNHVTSISFQNAIGLPTEARRVASHMNSPSTGEQQSSQDGESAFKSRAVRHWEAPCEPQLLSKVSTHPPELAPVRTGKAWEKADELDLDNASPYRSPGSGIQFSARSAVIAEGVVAFERFPTPVTAPDYDCCCQPLDSTSGAQHGLNGDTITVDAVASPADSAVPRSIHRQPPPPTSTATSTARYPPPPPALQRLRDCRLSARAHHEGRNALGVTRTSALTALRKRREHAAASKAAECEQMNLCSSTSEVHVDNDPASQPTNHSTSFQTDSGACTVQQKRVRVAPLTDALWSSAGHIRAHATRDRPHGSMELHHDRVSDSNERSEGLAGSPLAPPQPSISSHTVGSPHLDTATSLEHKLAHLGSRFAVRESTVDPCPSTQLVIRTSTPVSQVDCNPICEHSSELHPSPTVRNTGDDNFSGPVAEGLQLESMQHDAGPVNVSRCPTSESDTSSGGCAADHAGLSSDIWVPDSPNHMNSPSSVSSGESGPPCTPPAVALTRQLFGCVRAGTEEVPVLTAVSDAVGEGCAWSASRSGVAESWPETDDPALVWRNKACAGTACFRIGKGVPCIPIALLKKNPYCCRGPFHDSDSLSIESSPRIRSVEDEQMKPLLCEDGAAFERQPAGLHCIPPWGNCWHSDGGGCPLSMLVPRFPPLLRELEQSGSWSWSESPTGDRSPDPPWLEGATRSHVCGLFGEPRADAGADEYVPPHRHSAPAGPVAEGSAGWAAGLRRGRLYGSHMHDTTSLSDNLQLLHRDRARDPADRARRSDAPAARRPRRHTAQPTSPTRSEDLPFNDEIAKGAAQVVQRLSMTEMEQRVAAAAAVADAELSKGRYVHGHGSARALWRQQSAPHTPQGSSHSNVVMSAYQKQKKAADALAQGRSSSGFAMHATASSASPMHASAGEPGVSERRETHRNRSRSNAGGSLRSIDRPLHVPGSIAASRSARLHDAPSPRAHSGDISSAVRAPYKHSRAAPTQAGGSSRGQPPQPSTQRDTRKRVFGQGVPGPRSSPAPVAHMHTSARPSAQLSPPLARTGAASAGGASSRTSAPRSHVAAQLAAGRSAAFGACAVSGLSGNLPEMQEPSGISAVGAPGPSTVGGEPSDGARRDSVASSSAQRLIDKSSSLRSGARTAGADMGVRKSGMGDYVWNHKLPASRTEAMAICRQLERQQMQAQYDDLAEVVHSQLSQFGSRKMARSLATPPSSPAPSAVRSQLTPSPYSTSSPIPHAIPRTDPLRSPAAVHSPAHHSDNISNFAAAKQLSSTTLARKGHGESRNGISTPRFPGPSPSSPRPPRPAASPVSPPATPARSRAAVPRLQDSPDMHQQIGPRAHRAYPPSPSPPPPTATASAPDLLIEQASPSMSSTRTRWSANPLAVASGPPEPSMGPRVGGPSLRHQRLGGSTAAASAQLSQASKGGAASLETEAAEDGAGQPKPAMGIERLIKGQGTPLQKAMQYVRAREYPLPDGAASAPLAQHNRASAVGTRRSDAGQRAAATRSDSGGLQGPQSCPSPAKSKTWRLRHGKWVAEEGPGPEVQGCGEDVDMQDELAHMRSDCSSNSQALLGVARPGQAAQRWSWGSRKATSSSSFGGGSWLHSHSGAGQSATGASGSGAQPVGRSSRSRSTPSEFSGDGHSKAAPRGSAFGTRRPRRTSSPYRKESLPGKLSSLFRALTFRNRPARRRSVYRPAGHAAESVWRADSREFSTTRHAPCTRSSDFDGADRAASSVRPQASNSTKLSVPLDDSSSLLDYSAQFSATAAAAESRFQDDSDDMFASACCFGPGVQRPAMSRGDTQQLLQHSRSSGRAPVSATRHRATHQHHKLAAGGVSNGLWPVQEGPPDAGERRL